jgi:hypothetical protein
LSPPPAAPPAQHPPLAKPTGPGPAVVVQGTMPASDLAASAATPAVPIGRVRYLVLICLLVAGLSVLAGPGLLRMARQSAALAGAEPGSEPDADPGAEPDDGPDALDDPDDAGDTSESPGTNPSPDPSPSKGTGQ